MISIYSKFKVAGVRFNDRGHIHKDDIPKAEPILLEYIKAEPLLVVNTDFGLKDPANNFKMFKSLEKRKGILLKEFGEYSLFEYPTYIALLQMESKHVSYLVQFERKLVFGKKAVTQVTLWRERPNHFVANLVIDGMKLTAYVFFKALFEKNDCIVTDSVQTTMGREFWEDRISDAWLYGYPVYYINQVSKQKILLTSKNFEQISREFKIWSNEDASQHKKIAICKDAFWKSTQEV